MRFYNREKLLEVLAKLGTIGTLSDSMVRTQDRDEEISHRISASVIGGCLGLVNQDAYLF